MQKPAVTIHAPYVLRAPGLPFDRLNEFQGPIDQDKIWSLLDDPAFLDCLATMHHRTFPSLDSRRKKFKPGKRPSDVRRAELTLYRYLARFCSRNDTTGTAGTVSWLAAVPTAGKPGMAKFVYPSPRYVELMANRLAWGELRDQAYLTANSYIRWHRQTPFHLLAMVSRIESEAIRWSELSPEEQRSAQELLTQNVLGLRLGLPTQDRLTTVLEACRAASHPLQASLEKLDILRTQLQSSSGREYVQLMNQVDELMAPLAPYQALDFGHLLKWLVISGRDDAKTMLQLAPNLGYQNGSLFDKRYSVAVFTPDWAHPIVEVCQDPVSSADLKPVWPMVYQLLEEGVLVPAGAQVPSDCSWDTHYAEILNAMCSMQLTAPRDRIAQLLRQAWPVEPIVRHPVAAEADLAQALQGQIREIPLVGKDRNFLVCDSQRRIEGLAVSDKLRARIQSSLDPWFRFRAYWVYRDDLALTAILDQILPEGAQMPLAQFLGTAQQWLKAGFSPPFNEQLPFDIQYDRAEQIIHLVEDESNPNLDRWLKDKKLISSVDLMLGGTTAELEEGRGQLLLSEAHSGSEGLPATITFPKTHPDWNLDGYASSIFGDDTLILQPTDLTKQSEGILAQLKDLGLIVRDPECSWPQSRSIPMKRLTVVRTETGATILDEETRQTYQLVSSPWCIGNLRLVSFSPSELSQWLAKNVSNPPSYSNPQIRVQPEVRLGDLVLARRMAILPADLLAAQLDGLVAELALPRFTFFNTGGKPMLVDFQSEISREVLLAELAKADEVSLSPMQPQPDQLWLEGYCSELRFIATWQGEAFGAT